VERRYVVFFAIALAIIITSQMLQAWLYPQPAEQPGEPAEMAAREAVDPVDADVEPPVAGPAKRETGELEQDELVDLAAKPSAPRTRLSLGSLDPAGPARMLVTLTSLGGAVERIELADERFHDQDDRSGYLGHLAAVAAETGCRIEIVGPGTPADRAGLKPRRGDGRPGGPDRCLGRPATGPGGAVRPGSRRGNARS